MEKNKRIFSGKKRRKLKRGMGILLAMAVVLNTLPLGGLVVSASENKEVGICTHHKEHTQDCGYSRTSEDREGSPCTYECKLCPIEDLIANLPDKVATDNGETVREQLDEILSLYTKLTEDEQEQVDLSHCLMLQETLDVVNAPAPVDEEVSYRACDANGQNWTTETITKYTEVTSDTTTWSDGWYVVSGEVTISSRITVSGTICLILMDNCILNAEKGITVNEGNVLTIYAQSERGDMGKLTATGADLYSAGIGGCYGSGGTITINGGNITATGGARGGSAGIGGGSAGAGHQPSGGIITINGGIVTANGNGGGASAGAGIGGAYYGPGGTITINGGTVKATGGGGSIWGAAGIGGGCYSSGNSTITINGGSIEAYGSGNSDGIGNGCEGSGGTVTISGGIVTANGNGRGTDVNVNNNITGGTVNGTDYYAVSFDTNGQDGVIVPTQGVASGGTATKPDVKAEGWKLIGWYTDKSCTTLFSFSVPITENTILYAKWEKCVHTKDTFTNNSDGTHTWNCLDCGSTMMQQHTFGVSDQCICGAKAEAKVEKDGELTYAATLAEAFADSNNGATVTLLQDVTLSKAVIINYDFTLELNGYTITDGGTSSGYPLRVNWHWEDSELSAPANVTIRGNGSVLANPAEESGSSVMVYGNLTLEGGSFSGGTYGVRLMGDLASLTVTGEDVYIGTLFINSGKSGKVVTLTAGTYSNIMVVSRTLADLLGEGYAYYDATGKPLVLSGLGDTQDRLTNLTSSVTVKKCEHERIEYNSNNNGTHSLTCPYCDYTEVAENCTYSFSGNVGTCQNCKSTLTVSVTGTENLSYDNTEKKPAVTVKVNGDTSLTEAKDYNVSYTNNINAGDNASVTVTGISFNGTFTQKFSIKKATPDIGKVTAQELENTLDISQVVLNRENQTPDGTLKLIDGSTLQYGTKTYTWKFTPDDTANYLSVTGTVQITINDTIPPTAKYQIGTDKWKEFVKTISFGLFCKDYKTVELEFTDDTDTVKGSGIAKKQYYISDKEITEFDNIEWNEYTKTIHLDTKGTYFIYVNVSDNAGNEVILNSEGIVIYEESALSPAAFDYTYKQNKDCTVQLTMNGNTFKTLTDNKGNDISTSNYTVENGKLTLKAAYLDTLDKGEYTYKIYMNPQDVETDEVTLVYIFTVKVKAKELTVTGATATNRDYNGTNAVGITAIALSGIVPNDDVSVDLTGIQGLLSSANAGEYDSVTLPKLTLKGTSKSNYILVQPTKAVATSVTIEKAATEIKVGTSTYNKTFGDGAFTLDVTDNNLEKDVQYKVAAGEDIVSVENGTVNIKSAGIATITISLPASANYKAAIDKTITVNVAKKSGYKVEAVNKSYLYTEESSDTIDLAALLPKDCGTVTYKESTASENVTFKTCAVDDGKLSYTLESGSVNNKGIITVIATTQNYEDITITVNVKLTDKKPVKLKDGTKVTLKNDTLNFGEALSALIFNEADFVDSDGNKVEGTLTWKKEETTPDAGTTNATWKFLPTNKSKYETLEGIAAITVNKAVPVVDAVPTVTERVYNPSVTLKNSGLTGGKVSVEGSWSWERANIVPSVDNSGYVAVFTPTDKTNYETVTRTIVVKVTKATPYIKTAPSAAVITYGDALSVSNLAGGVVQYSNDNDTTIPGSFAWKDDSQKPVVAGSKAYEVVFTPADGENYNSVETTVTPTVLKAENSPNMPNSTMNVSNSCKKVSDVTLPDGWEWQEADKNTALEVGKEANAVAIYIGTDKGNYEKEMVTVAITRTSCDHVAGEILYTGAGEKAPTCSENGLGHRECTKCHSLIESGIVVTAFGHIHTELRGTVGATCMAGGYTGDSYCKDCGVKTADGTATGKLAHNYTSRITKEPTTTEEGVRTYTCMGCGNSYTDTISKLPEEEHKHNYSSQITKEPTCKEEGIATYSCSCGDSYTESIPVLNHSYTNWKSDETNHWHECSSCGDKKDTTTHTEDSGTVTKQPTETETGIRTYSCSVCQRELRTEIIDKLDHTHTYEAEWKSDEKNHWHECSSCGDKKDTTTHTEDRGTVTKQPTETETGIRTYSCSVCQRELRTEIIDKLDHTHTYEAEWKSDEKNHWHECSSCGDKKDTTTHTEDRGTVTKQPTETETGIRTYSCSVCQRELRTEIIDKLNHTHTYEAEWKSDEKNHWYECSCGEKSKKSNHNFGAWVVVKQPTEEKEGMRKRDCTVCGYQQTEKISIKKPNKNELALNAGLKVSQTGSQINIAWGKVSGASGYDVYVQYCGMKFSAKSSNQVKGGTKTKTTVKKVNGKKLDLKKSYKVYVVAYKLTGGKKVTISKSITAHIIGRNNKKYTNVKAVTVKKNSYILKKGKTAVIQAKTSLVSKGKKELPNNHTDKFRYASSNKKVATVSAKGKIKASGKGSCIIYIYAKNGYAKKIKVTVK